MPTCVMRVLLVFPIFFEEAYGWCPLCKHPLGEVDFNGYIDRNVHLNCSRCDFLGFTCSDMNEVFSNQLEGKNREGCDKCLQYLTREQAELYAQSHDYDWSSFLQQNPDNKYEKCFYLVSLISITHLARIDENDTELTPEITSVSIDTDDENDPPVLYAKLKTPTINIGTYPHDPFLVRHGAGLELGFQGVCSECGEWAMNCLGYD